MTRLHINIKEDDKAVIVFNLLKELPFVEVEETDEKKDIKTSLKSDESLEDLFGIWENRNISFREIRENAWIKNNDTL
jgi:hypothetical protein